MRSQFRRPLRQLPVGTPVHLDFSTVIHDRTIKPGGVSENNLHHVDLVLPDGFIWYVADDMSLWIENLVAGETATFRFQSFHHPHNDRLSILPPLALSS